MAAGRKSSRYGHRDATMILLGYRHGFAGVRVVRSAMVAGRASHRPATRPQGEERLAECPPDAGRRDTRAAASAARTGAVLARLYDRTGRADDAQSLPCAIRSDRGSSQDAIPDTSAHAAAWLRRYRLGSGTKTSSTRCVTPSCRRIGSRTSGADRRQSRDALR